MKVRPMNPKDVEGVYAIECASFKSPWSKESFEEEINTNALARYFVIEEADQLIAFGGMWMVFDELHITNIAVLPAFRGKGYGHVIVEALTGYAKENNFAQMTLEVRVSNTIAIHLYEKHGFKSAGVRPKYYVDTGEDALVMWKEI